MKRALGFAPPFAVILIALIAHAGPRPYATLTATPTTVVTLAATEGTALILQCPGGGVLYRTFAAGELAAQDGGLQADGGAFGTEADFKTQSDPIGVLMATNQVALGVSAFTDGGSIRCNVATP